MPLFYDVPICIYCKSEKVEDALEDQIQYFRELCISDIDEEVLELLRSDAPDDNLREYRLRQVESLAEAMTRPNH